VPARDGETPRRPEMRRPLRRRTRDQVKTVQRRHNLNTDGIVGPKTSHILIPHYDGTAST
jgi:peptidoglycan hydrolase-like protein with peptidoglycan-binding domain